MNDTSFWDWLVCGLWVRLSFASHAHTLPCEKIPPFSTQIASKDLLFLLFLLPRGEARKQHHQHHHIIIIIKSSTWIPLSILVHHCWLMTLPTPMTCCEHFCLSPPLLLFHPEKVLKREKQAHKNRFYTHKKWGVLYQRFFCVWMEAWKVSRSICSLLKSKKTLLARSFFSFLVRNASNHCVFQTQKSADKFSFKHVHVSGALHS